MGYSVFVFVWTIIEMANAVLRWGGLSLVRYESRGLMDKYRQACTEQRQ